ncbi:MAG: class I SAM-dependent methyltransferase [Candidatus Binataceae bacterium]
MAYSVKAAFDLTANAYDRARRQLVPSFDDFYRTAIDLLPFATADAIEVLDLGAGTGLLAAFIAAAFPNARLALVDVASEMLARARERFAGYPARARFIVSDYARDPFDGSYDAIVSALSIHHLADDDKRALFGRIHSALKPGGVFVNAEQVMGPSPAVHRRDRERWLRDAREAGVTQADLAAAIERMKLDRPATLGAQLEWLTAAGFRNVDCAYKNGMFAVYSGAK